MLDGCKTDVLLSAADVHTFEQHSDGNKSIAVVGTGRARIKAEKKKENAGKKAEQSEQSVRAVWLARTENVARAGSETYNNQQS